MPGVTMMSAKQSENNKKKMGAAPLGSRPASSSNNITSKSSSNEVEMNDAAHEADKVDTGKQRSNKKRRIVKTSDKKYECPDPDCTKSYSRAEHLYRHQLNHQPKQIYHCDFPGCDRNFVRADLCARHKERHTAKGSHLQRKDAFKNSQQRPQALANANGASESVTSGANIALSPVDSAHPRGQSSTYQDPSSYRQQYTSSGDQQQYVHQIQNQPQSHQQQHHVSLQPLHGSATGIDAQFGSGGAYNAYPGSYNNTSGSVMSPPSSGATRRYSMDGQYARPGSATNGFAQLAMHQPPVPAHTSNHAIFPQSSYQPSGDVHNPQYQQNAVFPSLPGLPPLEPYPMQAQNAMTHGLSMADPYAMDVFNQNGQTHRLQQFLPDQLFELWNTSLPIDEPSPPDGSYSLPMNGAVLPNSGDEAAPDQAAPGPSAENSPEIFAMDLSLKESDISEKKQQRLIDLISRFEDIERMPGRKIKGDILSGDKSDPCHPLGITMLKTYITSFWLHIHHQMPILHRPTFNPDTCPDLLLLAMMCLGACCLERTHSPDQIKNCAEFAFFAAYHIRWEVFKDAEFRPVAKLWTFQTMLLLELFEKMYSTRALHERAHIHHATLLSVMRRGSSLVGRGVTDETRVDFTRTPPGPDGTINTSGQNTHDAWWNRWITKEATARAAFAAFVIDSTHAPIFGHSVVMSCHELQLDLPCDEALWSATSRAEVQRAESSLAANGFKPIKFLDAVQTAMAGKKVRTNTFGRVIVMAGLLNCSWLFNQRDMQTTSVSAQNTVGYVNPKWRAGMRRAFDLWKRDFDESIDKGGLQILEPQTNRSTCHKDHRDNVVESRLCLHSLALMALHVDIVDIEVFAGTEWSLGRRVTQGDRKSTADRLREWAPSARARDAAWHAVKFLCEILAPDGDVAKLLSGQAAPVFQYNAREDYLLNRPYILYFACMTVWAYGYALDGPIREPVNLSRRELQIRDMQTYLQRIGRLAAPDALQKMEGRNAVAGLLMLMRDCFKQPRWELLHESSDLLNMCIRLLLPESDAEKNLA